MHPAARCFPDARGPGDDPLGDALSHEHAKAGARAGLFRVVPVSAAAAHVSTPSGVRTCFLGLNPYVALLASEGRSVSVGLTARLWLLSISPRLWLFCYVRGRARQVKSGARR